VKSCKHQVGGEPIAALKAKANGYLRYVTAFGDSVLGHGRDPFGSPLFVDGIDRRTGAPVRWRVSAEAGNSSGPAWWILSNLGNQQILLRTLDGLTAWTGLAQYREAARDAVSYAMEHARFGPLMSMGGHMAFDLGSRRAVHAPDKGPVHELKCHFPYYDFWWTVNPERTREYLDGFWECHVKDWDSLEFSRHGSLVGKSLGHVIWQKAYRHDPVFFTGRGLTFVNAGSDLIYAAAVLADLTGEPEPLAWAKRLALRYVEARNPETGLGGYQFSRSVLPGPGGRGDRAEAQFGEQLARYRPTEATLVVGRQIRTILGPATLSKLQLSERLGLDGRDFLRWAVEDLKAYAHHAYDPEQNQLHPLLTNGVRLTGLRPERSGYYGQQGTALTAVPVGWTVLSAYLVGYRLSRAEALWTVARQMAERLLGSEDSRSSESISDPLAIFCLIEAFRATGDWSWLWRATEVADAMIQERWHDALFVLSARHPLAPVDATEPLALLHLLAAVEERWDALPTFPYSTPFFGSAYGDLGHKIDRAWIYGQVAMDIGGSDE
jgi:pectate lyase